jgi:hypothetical protein
VGNMHLWCIVYVYVYVQCLSLYIVSICRWFVFVDGLGL